MMWTIFFLGCGTEEINIDFDSYEDETTNNGRPESNIPASVVGEPDLYNGEQIHERSCLSCHPSNARAFEILIPSVTDLAIETAIRNGKKGVPAALGERSPPDGALRLNLTDQDIIDIIAFVRVEYGPYNP